MRHGWGQEDIDECSNRIMRRKFLEIFYRTLNANTKSVAEAIVDRDFMSLQWDQATEI